MANFYIQYAASVTPVEELIGADGTDKTRIIHSNIDKSIGGGKEVTSGTAATDVVYKDYTTTASYVLMSSGTILGSQSAIDFMVVKIRESVDSDGDCDCLIQMTSGTEWVTVSKLVRVDDICMLRLNAENMDDVKIKSNSGKTCKVDILIGKEA